MSQDLRSLEQGDPGRQIASRAPRWVWCLCGADTVGTMGSFVRQGSGEGRCMSREFQAHSQSFDGSMQGIGSGRDKEQMGRFP